MSVIETASRVLRDEAAAVLSLVDHLDGEFEKAVCLIEASKGRVVLTGMGNQAISRGKWQRPWRAQGRRLFSCIRRKAFTGILAW